MEAILRPKVEEEFRLQGIVDDPREEGELVRRMIDRVVAKCFNNLKRELVAGGL